MDINAEVIRVGEGVSVLLERAQQKQDQAAYAELVLQHQSMVRAIVARLCPKEPHLVEDFVQETFIRAFASLHQFRQESKFSTWLYRIARNLVCDHHKRNKMTFCDLDDLGELRDHRAELHHCELRDDLAKAMNRISAAQQRAIQLCMAEGYTHVAAADIMGVPLGTVKSHVVRGRLQLQKILAPWAIT